MHQSPYSVILIACLILFGIYRRVRRNIGWQLLQPRKLRVRIVIFLVVGLLFLAVGAIHPISLLSDAAGIAAGIFLAFYGEKLTRYERRGEARYYRPNTWIGGLVTVLFLARLGYRVYAMSQLTASDAVRNGQANGISGLNSSIGNSWAAGLLLVMFAYYVGYYWILLRRHTADPASASVDEH